MTATTFIILGFAFQLVSGNPVQEKEQLFQDNQVTKTITLNNGLDYGTWGPDDFCNDGSYARDFEALFEPYNILHTDETALNALRLSCMVPGGHHTGQVYSTIGENGEWQGMKSCQNGLMTGMRAQVLDYRGSFSDDVAVQNVEIQCNYNESYILAVDDDSNVPQGEWSNWGLCDEGSAICGIKVRYEKPFLIEDTVGVSDIVMYCCNVDLHPKTTPTPMPTRWSTHFTTKEFSPTPTQWTGITEEPTGGPTRWTGITEDPTGAPTQWTGITKEPTGGPTRWTGITEDPTGAPTQWTGITKDPTGAPTRWTGITEDPTGGPTRWTGITEDPTGAPTRWTGITKEPTGGPTRWTGITEDPTGAPTQWTGITKEPTGGPTRWTGITEDPTGGPTRWTGITEDPTGAPTR